MRRTSRGVRGLKFISAHNVVHCFSRTSRGVRGLKLTFWGCPTITPVSHLSRGAWIEIFTEKDSENCKVVAPLAGCVD